MTMLHPSLLTYLTSIPKNKNLTQINHFWLIASSNVNYRILVKVLANRLKPFLNILITRKQSAFISEHSIYDNILITLRIYTSKGKNYIILIKIDLEKTFDILSWESILRPFPLWIFPPNILHGFKIVFNPLIFHA